jgi:DNA repair exonuclease SbcCD ATPase subunit
MAEGKVASNDADVDVVSLAIQELSGGMPEQKLEEVKSADEAEDLLQDETEEEASSESEDVSEDNEEATEDSESSEDSEDEESEAPSPDNVQKRINKLTAQKKAAAEEAATVKSQYEEAQKRLAELESQVNEASRPMLQPTAENPLADVDTAEALDAKIKSAQEVRRWALKNSDGASVKRPDGTETYLDSDAVKEYLIRADDILVTHGPARREWLAQRQPAVQAAQNLFPDIFKKGSALNQAYQATVKQAPELLKLPQHEYWVGLALYGEQQLMAKQAASNAKAAASKKVSSNKLAKTPTPANPISSPKTSTKGAVSKAAKDRVMSGRIDDLADYVSEALFN